ncbi:hypothetical protein GCM10007898_33830 [Dyella flagellata]|uniref:Uncharacterized protein n=2 Tax=Dyella flagellata TaxID=1867833 RepID=A0ABQ5XDT9_9GAMM|nr:hypothetical protein GCM10007898_33830 [Dyella flagellata]
MARQPLNVETLYKLGDCAQEYLAAASKINPLYAAKDTVMSIQGMVGLAKEAAGIVPAQGSAMDFTMRAIDAKDIAAVLDYSREMLRALSRTESTNVRGAMLYAWFQGAC